MSRGKRPGSTRFGPVLLKAVLIVFSGFVLGQAANWIQHKVNIGWSAAQASPSLLSGGYHKSFKALYQEVWGDYKAIKNAHAPQIDALVGRPDFVFDDFPTTIWQYRRGDCVLDVFFVHHNTQATPPVRHVEARSRDGEAMSFDARQLCVRRIMRMNDAQL